MLHISLLNSKNRLLSFLPISYFIILFLIFIFPNFGSIDNVGAQIFYLSVINTFYSVHLLFNYDNHFKNIFLSKINLSFLLFLFISLASFFWATNLTESVVKFSYWFNVYICFFLASFFFRHISLKVISLIITSFLLIHLSIVLSEYINIINNTVFTFEYANYLKGLASNKNISSALIFFCLPFVFISAISYKNYFYSIFIFILSLLSFYLIFASSSRSVFISLSVAIFFIFCFMLFLYFTKIKYDRKAFIKPIFILFFVPLLISYSVFNTVSFNKSDVSISDRISTINIDDTSTSNRLRFYNHALDQVYNSPFIGVGLGNWKFESIKYDSLNIRGYIVPYHVHNDFLEIATEIGLLGLLSYLLIFMFSVFILIKLLINSKNTYDVLIVLFLSIFLISYLIDANLNFPHARLTQQIVLIMFLSFIVNNSITKIK